MMRADNWSLDLRSREKAILAGLGILVLGFVAWWSYTWYTAYRGKKAQVILSECLFEYQKALETKDQMWSEVKLMNDLGFDQSAGSSLQPYFLIMQAQAFARQKKFDEAIDAIDQASLLMSDALPYKAYYALTKVLMQLDATSDALKEQGLAQLKTYAHDDAYQFQDAALYYLGDYYWVNNNLDEAKQAWQLLLDGSETAFKDSPWINQVESKYATL